MKYYELDKYEQEIEDAFNKGKLRSIKNFAQEKKKLEQAAKFTLSKTKNINIRVSERDLYKAKSKAAELGIPYQTFVSSLIHQAVA